MSSLLQEAKAHLKSLGGAPRKKWGQNFMISEPALRLIADALEIEKGEHVLEIGPGLGFLTRFLFEKTPSITAIDTDPLMAQHLKNEFRHELFRVLEMDFLKLDPKKDLDGGRWKVAGNIPYNITSPILEWLVVNRIHVSKAVLTMQWEVAERLSAKPSTKQWGVLSIFVQSYFSPVVAKRLGADAFYPAPSVDSAVVVLEPRDKPSVPALAEDLFFVLVRKAFQQRRKTLLNALADERRPKSLLLKGLECCGINPKTRPETLSLDDWARLAVALA